MGDISKKLHRKLASKADGLRTKEPKRRPGEPLPGGVRDVGMLIKGGLDPLLKFGLIDHLRKQWSSYYNTVRSHTERDHLPPKHTVPDEVLKLNRDQITVKSHVRGLENSFERKAA